MQVAAIIISASLAVTGLYLTHNLRRQQSLKVAEQRVAAYRTLWQLTYVARRTRWDPADGSGPLTREEARKLYRDMACWYYSSGNGIFLTGVTTEFYTEVRKRLSVYAMSKDQAGANRCMRGLSLLRQQMRVDLKTISGRPSYWQSLDEDDKGFLESAGIRNPERWPRPWYPELHNLALRMRTARRPSNDLRHARNSSAAASGTGVKH
jgi:hypothetical protein